MAARERSLLWTCVLAIVLVAMGCARKAATTAEHGEEHGEEHSVGPHGGALVVLAPEAERNADLAVDTAGTRSIEVTVELPGEIKVNGERSVDLRPAYPGRVVSMDASLGTVVDRGQPLAVIHSNESLSDYTLSAPITGTVIARPSSPGEAVDHESILYRLADLSTVWVDFPVYVQHLGLIHRGQSVHIRAEGGPALETVGTIRYMGPLLDAGTRTTYARVVLSNRGGRWQPGRLVTATVVTDRVTVPIAVPEDAIVRVGEGDAVFRADSSGYEVQPVTVGRSDGSLTEIVAGLERGARIVVRNAIWLKAELEKEAGGHED